MPKIDPLSLAAEAVLNIPLDEPEGLFGDDPDGLRTTFAALAKHWHSDVNKHPQAKDVTAHIVALHGAAKDKIARGTYTPVGTIQLRATDGKAYRLRYLKRHAFELGTMYISESQVVFCVQRKFKPLYDNALKVIKGLKFANDAMKAEMEPRLPRIKATFETADECVLVLHKDPSLVLLRDALDHEKGKIDHRHVAWLMRRLLSHACYLNYAGLAHNAIALDTYFVSPEHHVGALLGGWWYAAPLGGPLTHLPSRTIALAPSDVIRAKKADVRVDPELVRAMGRELLGDPGGSTLIGRKDIPSAFGGWLRQPTSGKAVADLKTFEDHVLPKSYGPRRFAKWNVKPTDIYQPRS
jgi:hypothetical protein